MKNSKFEIKDGDRDTRLLVYLSKQQRKGLKAAAKSLGTSQQVLIRAGVDLVLARKAS